jgi:amino acid transporter
MAEDLDFPSAVAQYGAPAEHYRHNLDAGSVGLSGVLMQSVAQISPTLGLFYTIAFNTGQAGIAAPLTYLVAFALCLALAVTIGGLARNLPSAGGFYTYVSDALGPRPGFVTGWLYAVMVGLVPGSLAAFTGAVLHDELSAKYNIGIPWWVYALAMMALVLWVAYRGIVISTRFMIVMGAFEIAVGVALALSGVIHPGPGGVTLRGFLPSSITSTSGFFLAVVLSIFAFTGFESAATIGEESRNPHRIIPRAIVGSVAAIGVFYTLCAWGLQVGWGVNNLSALANSPTAPAFVLSQRLWSAGWIFVLVALLNSGISVCIACTTSSTRTLYGMSRTGALPAVLGHVHPKHRTPSRAVVIQVAATVAILLLVGIPLGPYNLFNMFGVAGTFTYILIFILTNVAAFRFFRTRKRDEFNAFAHAVFPLVTTGSLIAIGYYSIHPLPAWPVWFGPIITVIYLGVGLVFLGVNLRPGRRDWMARAGELPDVA